MHTMENDTDTDAVIGLDVRGQVFYCNKSKLLNVNNGNSYFSARFREDSMLDAGLDRVDDEGKDIYKLDRDPSVFKYIMEYIDTAEKPKGIGVYEKNKQLWGLVREEALYFGLDGLVEVLMITFSCLPEVDGNKGIMYWLGTKKGTSRYVNPYSSGAVDIQHSECQQWSTISESFEDQEFSTDELASMVQYRPIPECDWSNNLFEKKFTDSVIDQIFGSFSMDGAMMGCDASVEHCSGGSIIFYFGNGVAVSPTHYSIRIGTCYGMAGDWNLEASVDGKTWDILHESRGRQAKVYSAGFTDETDVEAFRKRFKMNLRTKGKESLKEAVCDYMEENHRQTWKVNNTASKFYTYFRFLSVEVPELEEEDEEDENDQRQRCLHGVSFELYGDVCEEWGDESKTRIEQLENQVVELKGQNEKVQTHNTKLQTQNKTLLSENDSLKARVRQFENKRSAAVACLLEDR